jgi:hypothetical protein
MAGTLTISTLSDGTNSTSSTNCIQGSAKAWVNFNGSGGTIRRSYNVSSITVNSTGDYTLNFTTAMPNANSSVIGTGQRANTNLCILSIRGSASYDSITSSTARVRTTDEAGNLVDAIAICVSVFN